MFNPPSRTHDRGPGAAPRGRRRRAPGGAPHPPRGAPPPARARPPSHEKPIPLHGRLRPPPELQQMMARAQARTLARIERPTAEMLLQPRPPPPGGSGPPPPPPPGARAAGGPGRKWSRKSEKHQATGQNFPGWTKLEYFTLSRDFHFWSEGLLPGFGRPFSCFSGAGVQPPVTDGRPQAGSGPPRGGGGGPPAAPRTPARGAPPPARAPALA